jgi:hypothetical protein
LKGLEINDTDKGHAVHDYGMLNAVTHHVPITNKRFGPILTRTSEQEDPHITTALYRPLMFAKGR